MIVARAAPPELLAPPAIAAVDATGLETRYASVHYRYAHTRAYRAAYAALHSGAAPAPPPGRATYPKLTLVVHTHSPLIAGAVPEWGPSHDPPTFAPAMRQAAVLVRFMSATADAGYDAEPVHRLCREELGMRALYGERPQVESVISRIKRRLGPALPARQDATQVAEQVLRVLTHNLLLLHCARRTFQQSR